jgi:Fur family ferric uptake transcriptional regulator
MPTPSSAAIAGRLIADAGGRQTRPRVAALTALLQAGRTLSHAQLHERLPGLDRVSLYRALDWLAERNLAHRLTDANGVRRYGPNSSPVDHHHAHFHCTGCGHTACLSEVRSPAIALPKGYRLAGVELLVTGLCRSCATATRPTRA